jgi:FkbM family methyltransferase
MNWSVLLLGFILITFIVMQSLTIYAIHANKSDSDERLDDMIRRSGDETFRKAAQDEKTSTELREYLSNQTASIVEKIEDLSYRMHLNHINGSDNYKWAFEHMDPKLFDVVLELGSRDCKDAIRINDEFNKPVIAFEANPDSVEKCRKNLSKNIEANVILHSLAVSDTNGPIDFWSVDTNLYNNVGASSLFVQEFSNREKDDPDRNRNCIQNKITVDSVRLDSILTQDQGKYAIFMDIQGAELLALKGMGDFLKNVEYVVTEVSGHGGYVGGVEYSELDTYLTSNGFKGITDFGGNVSSSTFWTTDMIYQKT